MGKKTAKIDDSDMAAVVEVFSILKTWRDEESQPFMESDSIVPSDHPGHDLH